MVGDGINDAAALARADVGFAVASATDLSKQAGRVLLLRDRLALIPDAIMIAKDARRRLWMSLAWAVGYNAIGVGLAVSGKLHPVFAATAMAVSSLLVIGFSKNAGRLEEEPDREPPLLQAAHDAAVDDALGVGLAQAGEDERRREVAADDVAPPAPLGLLQLRIDYE